MSEPIKRPESCCDHEWETIDNSFDHEYGTEIIRYKQCIICGATEELDEIPDDYWDD